MNRTGEGIPLVPLHSPTGVYKPSIRTAQSFDVRDERYSSRTSGEQSTVTNANETITDVAKSPLLRLHSSVETSEVLDTSHRSRFASWLPEGWRFGATLGAALSLLALIANLTVLIVAAVKARRENGHALTIAPIRKGNCHDIEHIGLAIHVVINIVSTLLLGASNYCMQCLSAPTREDVNKAHLGGSWVDIGVISLKNFRFIRPIKLVFWSLLGLSSIPLHLLYNSTFFVSLTNNSYDIYYTSEAFLTGAPFENEFENFGYPSVMQSRANDLNAPLNGSYFERLNNSACIEAYAKTILPDRRALILVSSNSARNNEYLTIQRNPVTCNNSTDDILQPDQVSLVTCDESSSIYALDYHESFVIPKPMRTVSVWFNWICSQSSSYESDQTPPASLCSDGYWQTIKSNASQWTVFGFDIEYCISEVVEDQCRLNVATNLLAVVVAFNAVKFIVITIVIWKVRDKPLITVGDAAASFIGQPDAATRGMCLITKADVAGRLQSFKGLDYGSSEPQSYRIEQRRQASAASKARWAISIVLIVLALTIILSLLGYATTILKAYFGRGDLESFWDIGLGTTSPYTLIQGWSVPQSGDKAIVATVLIANLPQVLLSIIYVIINSLVTSMSLAAEWSRYAHQRRALRVSCPTREQRSTYFLQIPYRLGLPLMAFSSFLHWIISRSIFIAKVDGKTNSGFPDTYADANAVTCGYSPLGMIVTVMASFTLLVFVCLLGVRRLRPGMPLVGSCSVAIAAACHAKGTSELAPVMWGSIPGEEEEMDYGATVGHCTFSNERVDVPINGHLYA